MWPADVGETEVGGHTGLAEYGQVPRKWHATPATDSLGRCRGGNNVLLPTAVDGHNELTRHQAVRDALLNDADSDAAHDITGFDRVMYWS